MNGDTFANVSQRTGASGNWNDLMVVRAWSGCRGGLTRPRTTRSRDAGGRPQYEQGHGAADRSFPAHRAQAEESRGLRELGGGRQEIAVHDLAAQPARGHDHRGLELKPYDVVDFLSTTWLALARPLRVSMERERSTEREISY
jgi:hypothetical protein